MDRHRGDRQGNPPGPHGYGNSRGTSRFSDGPMNSNHPSNRRSPSSYRVAVHGGGGRDRRSFESPPRFPPAGDFGGGFHPMGGVGRDDGGFATHHGMPPLSGQKRGFPFSGRGPSPDRFDGNGFAKLFIGSVPRTATEDDIRPLFEEHGHVLEVALIRDKKTGEQRGCCFVKYATSEDADRAIRALHNQHTLPGGVGPIQVRYADGERERLGATEYKLFVGSLNRQASEKEVEEIFSPYGRVEDVYLMRDEMKQSRGCGFVKFSNRDMALEAINALNGVYIMRGCDQPLTVRFADPKRPRPAEPRGGPALGGPGFGPRFQAPGIRPLPNLNEPMQGNMPPNAWRPIGSQDLSPLSNAGKLSYGTQLPPRSYEMAMPSNMVGQLGGAGPPSDSLQVPAVSSALAPQQHFHPSLIQAPTSGQQISSLQKSPQSPQEFPSSLKLQSQPLISSSQTQISHASSRQSVQSSLPLPAGQTSFGQALPSQKLAGLGGQLPASQPQVQHNASAVIAQSPLNNNLQSNFPSSMATQPQLPGQQQLIHSQHQSPSQLAQMLSQQTQTLQASFQSSQQAFSQLQQQLQLMQPNQGIAGQQSSQVARQQPPWSGTPHTAANLSAIPPTADVLSASSAASALSGGDNPTAPLKCNWTEHTSPDGFKYYYNSTTGESKWEKPLELSLHEQQLQKSSFQQPQRESPLQGLSAQQVAQTQIPMQAQIRTQLRHAQQLQQNPQSSISTPGITGHQISQGVGRGQLSVAANPVNDLSRLQQGPQPVQDWMWRNKPAGT